MNSSTAACCADGLFTSQIPHASSGPVGPVLPFVLQIIPWALILIGGLFNKMSPGFVQPRGVLGSLFHKRLGAGKFVSQTPIQVLAVLCVLGFYGARFAHAFESYYSTEQALEVLFPGSNGAARATALSLYSVWYSMIPVQISLGVKNMFWFILAGLPVERAAAYHTLHGYLMCSVHIAAWISFAIGGLTYRPMLAPFCTCTLNPIPGLVSLVANIFIVLMSLPIVRRKNWEMFYLMGHLQLIPMITFGALFFDRVNMFPWLVAAFAQWGWTDIPLRFFMKVMQHTQVLSVEHKGGCAVLKLTKAKGARKALGVLHSNWEPGSYVWLAVRAPGVNPLKGKAPPPFGADFACYHPITIATPPIGVDGQPAKDFSLVIKSMGAGTWSEAVNAKARSGAPASDWKVWVGGPNGKLSFSPDHCDKIVLVAGGIGCTPMMALALWAHRRTSAPPPVSFIWVIRSADLLDAFESTLYELKGSSRVKLEIYVTGGGADVEKNSFPLTKGRPEFDVVVKSQAAGLAPNSVVGVYSCGPKPMMNAVAEAVAGRSGTIKMLLHEETFEL